MAAPSVNLLQQEAARLHRQGALGDAERRYREVLQSQPDHATGRRSSGGHRMPAVPSGPGIEPARRSLASEPHLNRARTIFSAWPCSRLGKPEEALASFDHAIVHQPDFADAHGNRANALMELGLYCGSGFEL